FKCTPSHTHTHSNSSHAVVLTLSVLSLSLSLSISLSHTHTPTHAQTQTTTHTHAHTSSHTRHPPFLMTLDTFFRLAPKHHNYPPSPMKQRPIATVTEPSSPMK